MIRLRQMSATSVLAMAAIAMVACGDEQNANHQDATHNGPMLQDSASKRLPDETLSDWVSYADAVVVASLAEATTLPTMPQEGEAGEGLEVRRVTVTIDEVIWQHPDAPKPPPTISFNDGAWEFKRDERRRVQFGFQVEPGTRYLFPAAALPHDGWGPTLSNLVPLQDGTVKLPEGWTAIPAFEQLDGLDLGDVKQTLTDAEPHPVAEANRQLNPDARWEAVIQAEASPATGG